MDFYVYLYPMASRFDTPITFNPYIREYPTELLMQTGMALHQGYMAGVQQVQNTIDQISGLDVIKQEDKNLLRQKLGGLEQEIGKFTTEDFRNPLVVGKFSQLASGILKDPSLQNAILGTKAYRTKKEQIDALRLKNPELYNPNNEYYAMLDVNNWLADGRAGSSLVDNHAYANYYDYSKEVREAMKDFKPASVKKALPDGSWIVTQEDKSYTESQIKAYLQGVLSDRAKQQMKIEAVTAFAGSDQVLLDSYAKDLKDTLDSNKKRIAETDVKCIMEKDVALRDDLNNQIVSLQNQNAEISDNLDKLKSGDTTFFAAHKENIAAQLFRKSYIDQAVSGYSHPDVAISYAPNGIWQTTHVQNMENARLSTRLKFEADQNQKNRDQQLELKELELGLKYMDKDGRIKGFQSTQYIKSQPNVGEDALKTTGEQQFLDNYKKLESENDRNYSLIKEKLLAAKPELNARYLDFVKRGGKESDSLNPAHIAAQAYLQEQMAKPIGQRDKWANDFLEEQNRVIVQKKVYDQLKSQIDNNIRLNFGKEYQDIENDYAALGKIKLNLFDITRYNRADPKSGDASVTFTPDQLKDLYFNSNQPLWNGQDYFKRRAGALNKNIYDYRIGGIEGVFGDRAGWEKENPKLAKFLSILTKNTKIQEEASGYRNKLYSEAIVNLGDYWTPVSDKDAAVKQSINYIQRQAGGDPSEYSVAFVNRTTGDVQFRVSPKKNSSIDPTILKSLGYSYNKENDTYTTGNLGGLFKRDVTDLTPTEKVLVNSLDGNVNIPQAGYYTPASIWSPSGNGQFMQIVKDKGPDGNFRYYLLHENSGTIIDFQDLVDPVSAIHAAKKLTADPKMLQDIIRKKNPTYTVK